MNEQVETQAGVFDGVKLVLAIAVLAGGVTAFYLLGTLPLPVRWLIVLGGLVLGIAVAMQSSYGRSFWQFTQSARIELRKIVWPTGQETLQTTLVVFVFVAIATLFFWALDLLLAWVTKMLTGQG